MTASSLRRPCVTLGAGLILACGGGSKSPDADSDWVDTWVDCTSLEELCDGEDNNCNGVVDDNPECGWWGGDYILTIIGAEGSSSWDTTNDPDFVVSFQLDGQGGSTSIVRESTAPVWNSEFAVTFSQDSSLELSLQEWDEDPLFGVDVYEPVAEWSWYQEELELFLTTDLGEDRTLEDGSSRVHFRLSR